MPKLRTVSMVDAASILCLGGVVVMPTDTLYGIVGVVERPSTVRRIYTLRKRNPKKPMIIMIGQFSDLENFVVSLGSNLKKRLLRCWPGKVSVILPIRASGIFMKKFFYLHRGTGALAFRMPKPVWLRKLLSKTGPLVVPSANIEGAFPAVTTRAAWKYFRDGVDGYVDRGALNGKPSTLVSFQSGKLTLVRKGSGRISPGR